MRDPAQAQLLVEQRQAARRARAQGRHWYLRAVLMLAIAGVAIWQGGQLYYILAAVMVVLAAMAVNLGKQVRMSADAMEQKIDLMEQGSGDRGQGTAG